MATSKRPPRPSPRPPQKKPPEVRKDEEITLVDVLGRDRREIFPGPNHQAPARKDGSGEHDLSLPDVIVTDDEDVERSSVTGWPEEIHGAFQGLWTKAVGQDGYNPKEWKTFRSLLDRWLLPPGA